MEGNSANILPFDEEKNVSVICSAPYHFRTL